MCDTNPEIRHVRHKEQSDWRKGLPFLERYFGGHVSFTVFGKRVTLYGFNAMHVAVNIHWRDRYWLCFHPTFRCFGVWWPWYLYASPDATPGSAFWGYGPGFNR